jgi:hypothetical protein
MTAPTDEPFRPDWTLELREEMAVALSLALHKHDCGGGTDEQMAAMARDIIAHMKDTAPDGIMFEKHNSPADDLVTDEMERAYFRVFYAAEGSAPEKAAVALRAVAPMIAAGARYRQTEELVEAEHAMQAGRIAAEREACAKIAENPTSGGICYVAGSTHSAGWVKMQIAAAIRARGETP